MKIHFRPIIYRLCTWLQSTHTFLKNQWARLNRHLGKMWVRFAVILIVVMAGVCLGKLFSPWFLALVPESVYGDIRTVVGAIPFTLPTFIALWWFRTYDSFQSNLRATFDSGVAHIVSETPNRIEIGTVMLINISEVTSSYNREIRTAFIRRLKQSPAEGNIELLGTATDWHYAQKMLHWLKNQNMPFDLQYVDLRNQDFTDKASPINVCDLVKMGRGAKLILEVAYCGSYSMTRFFGCCDYARAQLKSAQERSQWRYQVEEGAIHTHIIMEGMGCGKQPKHSPYYKPVPASPERPFE